MRRAGFCIKVGLLYCAMATAQPVLNKDVLFQDALQDYLTELEELQLQLPSDVFYGEGGVYSDFVKWRDNWGGRTNANGNFNGFFEAQLRSMDALYSGEIETISTSSWICTNASNRLWRKTAS